MYNTNRINSLGKDSFTRKRENFYKICNICKDIMRTFSNQDYIIKIIKEKPWFYTEHYSEEEIKNFSDKELRNYLLNRRLNNNYLTSDDKFYDLYEKEEGICQECSKKLYTPPKIISKFYNLYKDFLNIINNV